MRKKITIAIILLITLTSMNLIRQAGLGKSPKGERLERIKSSKNYVNGEFKNIHQTPVISSDEGQFRMMMDFMFKKKIRVTPEDQIPVVKTDIKALKPNEDVLIWFGHSSYFIQLKGKTFLVDPVFSKYASPVSFVNKAFKGTSIYSTNDLPTIDYLIITHDHYDHLDYKTVSKLKDKVKHVVCGLGVGQHFEHWGYENSVINELDWHESLQLDQDWRLTATPARHYSGRGLKSNQTLWASYVLQAAGFNIYIGGDSGYDTFFSEIGENYGPFDLIILEQGQYDQNWNLIHMLPDQIFKAANDLKAKRILPVHNSRFALANHPWDEPLKEITKNKTDAGIPVLTPVIGEPVLLCDTTQGFENWWEGIN